MSKNAPQFTARAHFWLWKTLLKIFEKPIDNGLWV